MPLRLRLRVGKLMKERDMTVAQLAKAADIASNTALSLSRGVATRLDLSVIERVASALEVRPIEMFEEYEDDGSGNSLLLDIESAVNDYAYA